MNMSKKEQNYRLMDKIIAMRNIQFVLSGFAAHLASHFGRSFKNHSYGYACLNDRPNCIASYTANSGSFVQYAG
jgi:hypothetical protein